MLWDSWGWSHGANLALYDRATMRALLLGRLSSQYPLARALTHASTTTTTIDDATSPHLTQQMHGVLCFVPATDVLDVDGYLAHAKQFIDVSVATLFIAYSQYSCYSLYMPY